MSSSRIFSYNLEAACKPSPCGENTQCEVIKEVPVCTCLPGYQGSPLTGCRHECESDSECPQHLACSSSYKCENPCKCGGNAECQVINHQAKCTCPKVIRFFVLTFNDKIIIIIIIVNLNQVKWWQNKAVHRVNFLLVSDMVRKSICFMSTGMHRPLGMSDGQTRLYISKMRESMRRRLRNERWLQPTWYYSRM